MRVYAIRLLLQVVPAVLMISLVVSRMMRSVPGDPVVPLLGDALHRRGRRCDARGLRPGPAGCRPYLIICRGPTARCPCRSGPGADDRGSARSGASHCPCPPPPVLGGRLRGGEGGGRGTESPRRRPGFQAAMTARDYARASNYLDLAKVPAARRDAIGPERGAQAPGGHGAGADPRRLIAERRARGGHGRRLAGRSRAGCRRRRRRSRPTSPCSTERGSHGWSA
jgi:hypothetical protein